LGKGHVQIVNSVRDIEEKFQDILLLKKNVEIISTLFQEMTRIVEEQNEALDLIEEQTKVARDKLEDGNKELDTAKEYKDKERTNKCCFFMWIMMALGAILIPVILAVLNANRIF
jgi:syntaxin 1B/2/3